MDHKIDRREFLIAGTATAGLAALGPCPSLAETATVRVTGLKVDYLDRPLGLDNPHPRFSWQLESVRRGVHQSAYRILVAGSEASLRRGYPELWDSGKVSSRKSSNIEYQGRALRSRQRYWWRVLVWDQLGQPAFDSPPTWWEMGLLSANDWVAQWLAADDTLAKSDRDTPLQWMWGSASSDCARKFRLRFRLPKRANGGVLYTFRRSFETVTRAWLDGTRIGTEVPGEDLPGERISFPPVSAGEHCLAIEMGPRHPIPDWPVPPGGLSVFARFDTDDGHIRVVNFSEWKTSCDQDPGWYERSYDDSGWDRVTVSPLQGFLIPDPAFDLRREFEVRGEVARARLYVTALGCYEARLNGERVSDALLTPEVSQYNIHTLYQVYDVRDLLRSGSNAIGLTVGDGWYGSNRARYSWGPPPRRVLAQLELTFTDGSEEVIGTAPGWRISRSPIVSSEFTVGELYDSRLEHRGWSSAGFDDRAWQNAEIAPRPTCQLVAQLTPPIRAVQIFRPQTIKSPRPGIHVFDFGQNFAGSCRLSAGGPTGTRIDLQFAEELQPTGEVDQFGLLGGKARDTYILHGDSATETFEPHFAYHGFRYVQLTGLLTMPTADTLQGIAISTDLKVTANFRTDNQLLQQIWHNAFWSQRSTFIAMDATETARDERLDYLGNSGVSWDSAAYTTDVAALTRRIMDNVRDLQASNGAFAEVAPAGLSDQPDTEKEGTAPAWSDGGIILPWVSWQRYGDIGIIEQNWEAMNRYLQFILDNNPDHIWRHKRGDDFGDWQAIGSNHFYHPTDPPTTPLDLIGTAYWAHSTRLLAEMSEAIGRAQDASRLRTLHEQIRGAFQEAFVDRDGRVGNQSQTSYVLALKFDLVPEKLRAAATQQLVRDIRERGIAWTTGMLGTPFILDVLTEAGHKDLVYGLLLRTDFPSWGFMVAHGATTMWEMWDGDLRHLHPEASHNQLTLGGSACASLFRCVAGIASRTPGFESILIRPILDGRVKTGGGDYTSMVGRISTDWVQHEDGTFALDVSIPANTTARIYLPAAPGTRAYESKRDILNNQDVRVIERRVNEFVIDVLSGTYRFSSNL